MKLVLLGQYMNLSIRQKIIVIVHNNLFNSNSLLDSFNFINNTAELYRELTYGNFTYRHECFFRFEPYKFVKDILYNKYLFGLEDKVMVPGNYIFKTTINGIPASSYDEIPYADTLHIELLKLTVNYDTGLIDTVRATEKIITADYIKPKI